MPDLAKQHTRIGAIAFAEYFMQALDWSLATTDPYLLREVSGPTCGSCADHISAIANLETKCGHVLGGRLSVLSALIVQGQFRIESEFVVEVETKQEAYRIAMANESVQSTAPPTTDKSLLFVSWVAGRWQVLEQSIA
jgi:Family of unknown function (DUF6318)